MSNINITIYDKATGLIDRVMSIPEDQAALNVGVKEKYLVDCPSEATHVIDGKPVVVPKVKTEEQLKKEIERAVQRHLDITAHNNGGWDSMLSARASTMLDNSFKDDAVKLSAYWATVWDYCFKVYDDCTKGLRSIPSPEEMVSELPKYE